MGDVSSLARVVFMNSRGINVCSQSSADDRTFIVRDEHGLYDM